MKSSTSWIIITVLTLAIIGGIIALTQKQAKPYTAFAQCLTESGATFHGAWWCPHCTSQKALFKGGKSALPYNECSNSDRSTKGACRDLNIGIEGGYGFPTWQFADGTFSPGAKTLSELSALSGCELPEELQESAPETAETESPSEDQ